MGTGVLSGGVVVYHSGAGGTRVIAEIVAEALDLDVRAIGYEVDFDGWAEYDFFVLAFPIYHSYASSSMQDFINGLRRFDEPKKAYVVATCGLFEDNAIRHFYELCRHKNILICGAGVYRAPATDGVLLMPAFSWMFRFGSHTVNRLKLDIGLIGGLCRGELSVMDKPKVKWYTLLNYPNKKLGKWLRHRLRVDQERCIQCGVCVKNCVRGCLKIENGVVQVSMETCENCFKCVHHCPTSAIWLSRKTPSKFKLTHSFYENLKEQLRKALREELR